MKVLRNTNISTNGKKALAAVGITITLGIGLVTTGAAAFASNGSFSGTVTTAPTVTAVTPTVGTGTTTPPPIDAPHDAQPGPGGGFRPGMGEGNALTITALNGNTLTVKDITGATSTITVTAQTVYQNLDKTITLADLKVGTKINVRDDRGNSASAAEISVAYDNLGGTISAVNGSQITVTRDGASKTINVDASTVYNLYGTTIKITDLKSGDMIEAIGTANSDGSFNAVSVDARGATQLDGIVTAINGSELTVNSDGWTMTIVVSSGTVYDNGGSLASVTVGTHVHADGSLAGAGKLNAAQLSTGGEGGSHGHGGPGR